MAELRKQQLAAGGPISLTQLLRMSRSKIGILRANRVKWSWIASRVLAAQQTTVEAEVPEDMPPAGRRSVRQLSTLWRRVMPVTSENTTDPNAHDTSDKEAGSASDDPGAPPLSNSGSQASDDVPPTPKPSAYAPRAGPSGDTTASMARLKRMQAAKRLPTINDLIRGDDNENP